MRGGLPNAMPITTARPNPHPVSPNIPASVMLLIILASLLAVGLAVARDQLDDRVHTPELLETLTGRWILASLPHVKNGFSGLVTNDECPPALLESFRILRGNILLSTFEPLPRTIMVTSQQAGEGKSTTVANLAATFALGGKHVLVIDCDLRHPSLHLIYGVDNSTGLSSVLLGEAELAACIRRAEIEGLEVLTAGPPPARPPELLASAGMRMLLERVRDQYDCVLLDSTPLMHLSDGSILASYAEGVLMVVSSDRSRQSDLQSTLRMLEHVGVPILGLVYNRSKDTQEIEWRN